MVRIKSNKTTEKLLKKIETLSIKLHKAKEELNALKYDEFTAITDSGKGGDELLHNSLTESEGRFRALAENIPDMIVRFDSDLRLLYGNHAVLNRTGLTLKSLIGKTPIEYGAQPETVRNWENAAHHVFNTGETVRLEHTNYWQGEEKVFDIILVPEKNSFGKVGSIISIARDITEMKKAEESLQENERKLRSVLNATLESVYMFDRDGRVCMSNTTGLERLHKKNESEVIGCHFSEFMSPEIARMRQEKFDDVFNNGYPLEFEDERAGQTYHHNFFPVFRDKEVIYVVSFSTDITARKKAETKLMESEDRFRTIAESLTVMISITRISDSIITFVNEPFETTFGFNKDGLIGKKLPDKIFSKADLQNIRNILNESDGINNREIKVNKADGSSFWIMLTIKKINFLNEPSLLSASIDITSSKRAQMELIRLNRVLDAHSKSSQAMMHADNEFNYMNEVCKIIIEDCGHTMVWIGYAQNDARKSVLPVAYYGFDKGYIDQLNISWTDNVQGRGPTGTAIRTGEKYICRNMMTDPSFGPWREAALERGYASSIVLPLRSEGRTFGAISVYSKDPDPFSETEISFLSDLADDLAYGISFLRLAESERAAARAIKENEIKLKELITTKDKFFNIVAHDLKNPFTSLLGASELLYENIDEMSPENVRKLALILNASARGGYAILQNLLDWSRSQTGLLKFSPKNFNLRDIIDENVESLQLQNMG